MAKKMFWVILLLLIGRSIPAAADACTDQCWLDYDACVGPGCSSYWHCAACDEARDSCFNSCPPPPNCPSTRDYTTTTVANQSITNYNVGCFLHPYTYPEEGRQFNRWRYRYRYDTYRETTNCNGSKTTQLLSTSYSAYTYCVYPNSTSCANPLHHSFSGYPLCP